MEIENSEAFWIRRKQTFQEKKTAKNARCFMIFAFTGAKKTSFKYFFAKK